MTPRTADRLCAISRPPLCRISALTWKTIPFFMRYCLPRVPCREDHGIQFNVLDGCPVFRLTRASPVPWIALCREYFPLHSTVQPIVRDLCRERPHGPLFPDIGTENVHRSPARGSCLLGSPWVPPQTRVRALSTKDRPQILVALLAGLSLLLRLCGSYR